MPFKPFIHFWAIILIVLTIPLSTTAVDFPQEGQDDVQYERPTKLRRLNVALNDLESSSILSFPLLNLPEELLVHIFTLANEKDLLMWRSLSHKLYNLVEEEFCKRIYEKYPQYGKDQQALSFHEVKSPSHLLFLLDHLSNSSINYKGVRVLHKDKELLKLLSAAFLAPKASYFKGVLFEMGEKIRQAWEHYAIADQAGQELAKTKVNNALYYGNFEQGKRPMTKRFMELMQRAQNGEVEAQRLVNKAIYSGNLGQSRRPMAKRFMELNERARNGDIEAQKCINHALDAGTLGQNKRSEEDRLKELYNRAKMGDTHAEELAIAGLSFDLGFIQKKYNELEKVLIELAELGSPIARNKLYRMIYFYLDPFEERFIKLNTYAQNGDELANKWVKYAIYIGELGQDKIPESERWAHLLYYANKGDSAAQRWVNYAVYLGTLGQAERPDLDRLNYLRKQDNKKDIYANEMINESLYEGSLGQRQYSPQERFNQLKVRANNGDKSAQKWLNKAIYKGKLGQEKRHASRRFRELETYAKKGSIDAQNILYDTIRNGGLEIEPDLDSANAIRDYFNHFHNLIFLFSTEEDTIDLSEE